MAVPSKREIVDFAEENIHGLRARVRSDGALSVKYEMGGHAFKFVVEKRGRIRPIKMPFSIAAAIGQDIASSSLEEALAKLPKRLKAYLLRRQQVEDTERKHAAHLLGQRLHTAGNCTFVRADLQLTVKGHPGVLRLEVRYHEFSVHPVQVVVKSRGSPEFMDIVTDRVEDIRDLLESTFLDEACGVLCS
ncbi:hypothetical protein MRX96_026031 [Rhipicephalus microplus]|uniref:Uncharacterized protein n=1 Tax=Rhipicephalus microplus TaxID=6941 RepID=A0A9J6EXC3_RHIMP|nr:hypothetical protein HPB51_004057 [Rhipicephalus microplus]